MSIRMSTMNCIVRLCSTGLLLVVSLSTTSAQIIRAGIKAGPQLSWVTVDDPKYNAVGKVHPIPGFHAGAVLAFKVKDRYFLNTEYIYSQKGKNVTGKIDPNLNDKVIYRHIDVPILFSMYFKGKFLKTREFKWYINAGPNISYWLGGNGVIEAGDLIENGIPALKYKIAFGTRPDHNDPDILYIKDAKRLQFGMNVGGGILLEPGGNQKVLIDFRYEIGHTQIGNAGSSQFLIPSDYQDNMKGRNKGIRLSLIYLYEFSSDPKERNKGKSTINKKK
ncbi:MAG: PorT family protein [Cyclobacteriaceae bacterium]|nr:PorT family protein [Cyclobacteriaceae bacterium]MDH4296022.1 PorT family protein [Cyclobacteriaceae bacterium]MDH5250625.1 PorT family protein [Cyclobacteriaceae bacterium]